MIDKDINFTRQKRKSSEARSSLMVFPKDTNDFGTMYGGRLIELMDMVGGICARRYTGTKAVTASIEDMQFYKPINTPSSIIAQKHYTYMNKAKHEPS